ncbi:hypothetical protein SAMN04487996_10431 [Dyadobacter soli]|uniref:Lipoprotein n=1 Tax=Dyadobacter soli TaxID=659014 RepID=A0A1G7B044_9BACT|nr:hypothetical protein [Dyadobacter soli]SDE20413.1 hypothetical protein SAMN04487996_10431 [Dyadobacter soli]
MKKCFVYLLLAALSFLSCYGLFACRSFKKGKLSADSTIVRNVEEQNAWRDETIQEIVIESDELPFIQSGAPLSSLLGLIQRAPGLSEKDLREHPTLVRSNLNSPIKKKVAAKVAFRQITRHSSQQFIRQNEEKHVKEDRLEKERKPNATGLLSIGLITVGMLIIIIILLKSNHSN